MGSAQDYQPHKLIVPALCARDASPDTLEDLLAAEFGTIDARSDAIPFTFTDFYDDELGPPVTRVLYSFEDLVDPASLAGLKVRSNALEEATARADGTRSINVDPGLLSLSRVVLATTKPSAHRIAIGSSLYAEITLLYRKGVYAPLEWTYPDFRSGAYDGWLASVRERYHAQLREIDSERRWRL